MLTCGKIYVKIFDVADKLCYCGSMAEQLIRNEQVVSSILTSSSTPEQRKLCSGFLLHNFKFYQKYFFNTNNIP